MFFRKSFCPHDRVIFRRQRYKPRPGRHAREIRPAVNGDDYCYTINKYWVVSEILNDGQIVLQTPRGKRRVVRADDPNLRHASWLDKIRYRYRFLQCERSKVKS